MDHCKQILEKLQKVLRLKQINGLKNEARKALQYYGEQEFINPQNSILKQCAPKIEQKLQCSLCYQDLQHLSRSYQYANTSENQLYQYIQWNNLLQVYMSSETASHTKLFILHIFSTMFMPVYQYCQKQGTQKNKDIYLIFTRIAQSKFRDDVQSHKLQRQLVTFLEQYSKYSPNLMNVHQLLLQCLQLLCWSNNILKEQQIFMKTLKSIQLYLLSVKQYPQFASQNNHQLSSYSTVCKQIEMIDLLPLLHQFLSLCTIRFKSFDTLLLDIPYLTQCLKLAQIISQGALYIGNTLSDVLLCINYGMLCYMQYYNICFEMDIMNQCLLKCLSNVLSSSNLYKQIYEMTLCRGYFCKLVVNSKSCKQQQQNKILQYMCLIIIGQFVAEGYDMDPHNTLKYYYLQEGCNSPSNHLYWHSIYQKQHNECKSSSTL